jgi:hypothetical protein
MAGLGGVPGRACGGGGCGGVESVLVQFVLLCPRSALASLELLDHVWARQEGSYSGRCKRGTHGIVVYAFIVLE